MRHAIPLDDLGPAVEPIATAVEACVHCGFCLPTCPTYVTLGEEMDSPRGRILLAKGVLEGTLELDDALPYLDNCLGCQACVTACPSGVQYGELINSFRAYSEPLRDREPCSACSACSSRRRFRTRRGFGSPLAWARSPSHCPDGRAFGGRSPTRCGRCSTRCPTSPFRRHIRCRDFHPAEGPRRARVALLAGCVQQALDPEIGWATLRVLARNGVETVIPRGQGCCGALALHSGQADQARALARRNLAAFAVDDVDAIITNTAGCGSGMHDYEVLFRGEPDQVERRPLRRRGRRRGGVLARAGRPRGAAAGSRGARRLPRRVPPGTRPRGTRRPTRAAGNDPGTGDRHSRGVGALLRIGRDLQHRKARDRTRARRSQSRQPAWHRCRADRRREHRLHRPDPHPSARSSAVIFPSSTPCRFSIAPTAQTLAAQTPRSSPDDRIVQRRGTRRPCTRPRF